MLGRRRCYHLGMIQIKFVLIFIRSAIPPAFHYCTKHDHLSTTVIVISIVCQQSSQLLGNCYCSEYFQVYCATITGRVVNSALMYMACSTLYQSDASSNDDRIEISLCGFILDSEIPLDVVYHQIFRIWPVAHDAASNRLLRPPRKVLEPFFAAVAKNGHLLPSLEKDMTLMRLCYSVVK